MATKWRSGTLTILSGQTASEELDLTEGGARYPKKITVFVPDTLPDTVKVYIAPAAGGSYKPLTDSYGSADLVLQAGKGQGLPGITAGAMKLVATSGAVAANRVFQIQGTAELQPSR